MKLDRGVIEPVMNRKTLALLAVLCPFVAMAEIKLPALFSDGAVLQRDRELTIWGWATPQKDVTVVFAGQQAKAQVLADGTWSVKLAAMPASAEPRSMQVSESEGAPVVVNNLLVGEVWLASGQSNMEWSVAAASAEDQAKAQAAQLPLIRMIKVPHGLSHQRQEDFSGNWQQASPEMVRNFSAVGYFYARQLHEALQVPIGIINSSWGGTRIDPWLAEEGFASVSELGDMAKARAKQLPGTAEYQQAFREHLSQLQQWCDVAEKQVAAGQAAPAAPAAPGLLPLQRDAGMYQAMIHPLRRYALRGFIWYQGESNNGEGMLYYHKMRVLIDGWRKQFAMAEAPFYFVQLAPFSYKKGNLPEIWVAQQWASRLPHTGMAVINDIGNVNDIHPGNKSEVGRRLALWALDRTYGIKQKVVSGPLYRGWRVDGSRIRVSWDHVGSGLVARDGKPLTHFEIAGADGTFHPAIAEIDPQGQEIWVSSAAVPAPELVRFAWSETAEPNLMNREGLPAAAFHCGLIK